MEKIKLKGVIIEKGALDNDNIIDLSGVSHKPQIPVSMEFSEEIVGKAKTYMEDGILKADLEINEEKRFDLLYPAIQGQIIKRQGNKITKCKLMSIGLCSSNADPTIKTIGEQTK